MGKPRQGGDVIGTSLIIDKASKRPRWARRSDWALSLLMWLVYLFLVRDAVLDLIVLIKDTLEWALAGDDPPYMTAILRLLNMLQDYAVVIVANGAVFILWARYNQLRFRRSDLRKPPDPVTVEDMARLYGLSADDVESWRQSRILIMRHDDHGHLLGVMSGDTGAVLSMADRGVAAVGGRVGP